jgi:REP element-mobilizing transposase RayT
MNRGRRREEVFLSRADYESFLEILRETSAGWNIKVAAYCLMPNHYHLLVTTPEGNISRCMRHINGVYTQRFNRQHRTDGQLFRGRYKAVLVEADSHLLEVMRYIHRNPIRGGLAETVDDYPWSSHRGYVSSAKRWAWLEKDFLLSMLCGKKTGCRAAYRDFVCQDEPERIERFYALKNLPSVLGGAAFKEWLKDTFPHLGFHAEVPQSRLFFPTAAEIIAGVCAHFQVEKELMATSRRGAENLLRDVAIYLVRLLGRETLAEVGKNFGMNNYSTVGSAVARVKLRLINDRALQKHLEEIQKKLDKSQGQV